MTPRGWVNSQSRKLALSSDPGYLLCASTNAGNWVFFLAHSEKSEPIFFFFGPLSNFCLLNSTSNRSTVPKYSPILVTSK